MRTPRRTRPIRRRRIDWNGKFQQCVNCGTTRFDRRDRGYCARCFPAAENLRMMENWNIDDIRTWKGCPYQGYALAFSFTITPRDYVDYCRGVFRGNLQHYKYTESAILGELPIDGVMMENLFRAVARDLKISNWRSLLHGWAGSFDEILGMEEKRLLYNVIDDLLWLKRSSSPWIIAVSLIK